MIDNQYRAESFLLRKARIVATLTLRESRVTFGSAKLGYFWAIADPVLGTALLTFIFSFITRQPPLGQSFPLFFATGIITIQYYQKLSGSLMAVFEANKSLLVYPRITETDVIFGRFFIITATYLTIYIVFFSGLIFFGKATYPDRLDIVLVAILSIALLGFGVGVSNAVLCTIWPTWKRVESIATRPLFFLSGVFFIPDNFSANIRYYLSWNPILHAIDLFRVGYYASYQSRTLDLSYLWMCISLIVFISLGSERLFRKKQN